MTTCNTDAAPSAMVPKAPLHPENDRPDASTVPTPAGTGVETRGSLNQFRAMGGSAVDAFNSIILRETLATVWCQNTEEDTQTKRIGAVGAALTLLWQFKGTF